MYMLCQCVYVGECFCLDVLVCMWRYLPHLPHSLHSPSLVFSSSTFPSSLGLFISTFHYPLSTLPPFLFFPYISLSLSLSIFYTFSFCGPLPAVALICFIKHSTLFPRPFT